MSLILFNFMSLSFFLCISFSTFLSSSFSFPHNLHDYFHHSQLLTSPSPSPDFSLSPTTMNLIQQACNITRNIDTCISSLSNSNKIPPNPTSLQIIQASIWVSTETLKTSKSLIQSILDSSNGNETIAMPAYSCLMSLTHSEERILSSLNALSVKKIKDARAWMSAVLSTHSGCSSGLEKLNDTSLMVKTVSSLNSLVNFTTNALSMIVSYDYYGDDIKSWLVPKTERDGFWERNTSADGGITLNFPSNLTVNAHVCKGEDQSCYKSVQDAVDAAPINSNNRFVIYIKEGLYDEIVRIPFEKKNVVFLGDGMGKTIITGSLNVGQPKITTTNSSTVGVAGDGFMAKGITFQNTAGPEAHQAVAFRSSSDLSIIESCEFLGNQDTLYVSSLRQYYKSCRIQGNVDFIFGNAAAIFEDCKILIAPRQLNPEKGEQNAITAHGRNDPLFSTGFVFHNCLINGTEEYMKLYNSNPKVHKSFLGRPWKKYSRTLFIRCNLDALINTDGWLPWNGDYALSTLYYGEFENSGPGSNTSNRVPWSNQIPKEHVNTYSVINFIQGDEWNL